MVKTPGCKGLPMKITTSTASGKLLNWLVAEADHREVVISDKGYLYFLVNGKEEGALAHYESSEALTGKILDNFKINTRHIPTHNVWEASNDPDFINDSEFGATRKQAALRYFVRMQLGPTYEVPDVLCQ
jgi:Protein of unknown function (DUF2591)